MTYRPEAARERRYGLSPQDVQELLDDQEGRCAICRRAGDVSRTKDGLPSVEVDPARRSIAPKERSAVAVNLGIDHDHTTGVVRGLLCSACNTGLSWYEDDQARLMRAAAYLRRKGPFKTPRVVPA
jgi:hypothetical protein